MDFTSIDFSDASDPTSFEPVPPGWYKMIAEKITDCETKNGTGRYLKAEFQIVDGERKGRKVWANFNYKNASIQAERIGKGQLKALAEACGKDIRKLKDPAELCNVVFLGKLSVEPASAQYSATNRLQGTKRISSGTKPIVKPAVDITNDDIPF